MKMPVLSDILPIVRDAGEIILRRELRPKTRKDGVLICGAYGKGNAGDDSILEAQSPNVDALTGATVTSNAILGAVKKALTAAGADLSAFCFSSSVIVSYDDLV